MKIALFTETYLPSINGVVTHVKTLKDGLEKLGHKVLIVTADSRVKRHETDGEIIYCPAVRLKKIYNYDVASPISIDRLKMIKEFNPDIIHIHNEFGVGISGVVISKMLKVPLVYTLHTMYDDYVYYVANKHFCKFVTQVSHKYAKVLAGAAEAITGPSKKVEEYFQKCGVKKPVNVIPNSVELDKFSLEKADKKKAAAIRKEFGFSDKDTVFCFCGRLGKEKNVSLLLKYWSETVKPDDCIKLFILGDGPLHSVHVQEAKDYNIDSIVKFAGKVEHDNLPEYYAACDAYITASLSDTCSISMLEGMAMELPVLHIRDELNTGQVINGVNGYIYSSAAEMYELLQKIHNMPKEELKKFGEETRQSIISSGSVQLARSILSIYDSVIEEDERKKKMRKAYRHNRFSDKE